MPDRSGLSDGNHSNKTTDLLGRIIRLFCRVKAESLQLKYSVFLASLDRLNLLGCFSN